MRSQSSNSVPIQITDVTNMYQAYQGLISATDPGYEYYTTCANYDDTDEVSIVDISNTFQYYQGVIGIASHF